MPPGLGGVTAEVAFSLWMSTTETILATAGDATDTVAATPDDHLIVELRDNGNNLLRTLGDFTNMGTANTWQRFSFNVSDIAHEKFVKVVFRLTTDADNPTTFYVDTVSLNIRHLIPRYWDPAYLDAYGAFAQALADHFRAKPDIVSFVAYGTGKAGENVPTDSKLFYVLANAGLDSAKWIETINKITKKFADAFYTGPGQMPFHDLMLQYAPAYKSATEKRETTRYATGLGVGLSSNFLSPDWNSSYRDDDTGFYDPMLGVWPRVPLAHESYDTDLCNPVLRYWAYINGLDKHPDYIRADEAVIKRLATEPTFAAWIRQYLGKSPQTTPSAWVVLREHRNPTYANCRPGGLQYTSGSSFNPQLGNYSFFLYQDDSVAGGRTVPETNDKGVDSRYAYNPDAPATKWDQAGLGNCPFSADYDDMFGPFYATAAGCNRFPYNPLLPKLDGQRDQSLRQVCLDRLRQRGVGSASHRSEQRPSQEQPVYVLQGGQRLPDTDQRPVLQRQDHGQVVRHQADAEPTR